MDNLEELESEYQRGRWFCFRAASALKRLQRRDESGFPSSTARLMNCYAEFGSLPQMEALNVFLTQQSALGRYKFCPTCGKYFAATLSGGFTHQHAVRSVLTIKVEA